MGWLWFVAGMLVMWAVMHTTTSSGGKTNVGAPGDGEAEGNIWEALELYPVDASLRIRYTDAGGRETERTVDVKQFGRAPEGMIMVGHCHLRRAARTFRIDRVKSCFDVNSGEVIEDAELYLRRLYDSSPIHAASKFLEEEYDALRVLLYVAKADGRLTKKERAIIRETCRKLQTASTLDDDDIDKIFSSLSVPSEAAFHRAVGKLKTRSESERIALMSAACEMVESDKTVKQREMDAIAYLRDRLEINVSVVADPGYASPSGR